MSNYEIDLEEEFARSRLNRAVARQLWRFLRPHRAPLLAAVSMEGLWVLSMLAGPHLVKVGLDEMIPSRNVGGLVTVGLLFLLAVAVRLVLNIVQIRLIVYAGFMFLYDLRQALFRHIQALSMRYFDRTRHGRIIARVDRDTETLEGPVVWGPLVLTSCCLMLVGVMAMMLSYDPVLGGAMLLLVPALVLVSRLFRERGLAAYRIVRESFTRITAHFAETINGVRVIQAFVGEDRNQESCRQLLQDHNDKMLRAAFIWNGYVPSLGLVYVTATLLLLILGWYRVEAGQLQIGELTAFVILLGMFFRPIEGLGDLYSQSLSAVSAAERIFLLLDTPPEITDDEGARELPPVEGRVRFEDVHFSYGLESPEEEGWQIKGMHLEVPPGCTAAFVGETGAGKSSIINLVARFYDVTGGRVTIDDHDVRHVTLASLHDQMGLVLQESFLFQGTVMENIRFARPEATEEEAIAAAEALGCDEIFRRLPDGYDTAVGDRGGNLSEGERQLVAFTRAMLADPRILILDEATSSVDILTEQRIQEALGRLSRNRTTLVVAHRLATIMRADIIFVIHDGRIVEQGTHDELLQREGLYHRMVQDYMQLPSGS